MVKDVLNHTKTLALDIQLMVLLNVKMLMVMEAFPSFSLLSSLPEAMIKTEENISCLSTIYKVSLHVLKKDNSTK